MNEVDSGSGTPDAVEVAADAVRRLTAAILESRVRGVATPDVSEKISVLADRLEAVAAHPRECVTGKIGTHEGALQRSPVSGPKNPVAIPLRFEQCDDGSSLAHTEFPRQYQGPPGLVHGGVSGLVLDVAMAVANSAAGRAGVTAEMTLRYLRPTPLYTEVTVRGRHVRVEGRKTWSQGTLEVDGETTVVCDGLFITKELAL
ncbi:PaaI family thioesterase [Rhodococcus artemisiae]|uniref:Acyl-coenzyme A thioesterase THEM4 n=1 Tax=Rhodococcus artemisiae TaxID=714159 RepID=A0ABU7L6R4_9NOCA|nr:PaaI family thioesterase [Rhodococcus artemisiae]MEE2057227.1 PaaI family thioesterase [Rhodococcus artemisiae]